VRIIEQQHDRRSLGEVGDQPEQAVDDRERRLLRGRPIRRYTTVKQPENRRFGVSAPPSSRARPRADEPDSTGPISWVAAPQANSSSSGLQRALSTRIPAASARVCAAAIRLDLLIPA
jgi:hypothetical protein